MLYPTKIILNADDLGASLAINDAIFGLMAKGRLTSATLLANGAAVEDTAHRAREFPQCSFGVHLNLTEFRPLTAHPGLQPLLGSDGCFAKKALRSIRLNAGLRQAILEELHAQVDRVRSLGVAVSHFDSHHHVHTVPALFGVLKTLQRQCGVRKVRLSMNLYATQPSLQKRLGKALWNAALRHYHVTTTTDLFTSLVVFGEVAGRFTKPPQSIELMTHPGDLKYQDETQLLANEIWRSQPFPVQLISYNQI